MLIIIRSFTGYGYSFEPIGKLIDPPEPIRSALLAEDLAAEYEAKVMPLPSEVKKNGPGELSPAGPARQKRTRKGWQEQFRQSRSMIPTV